MDQSDPPGSPTDPLCSGVTHLSDDTFVQKVLLLCRHYKVVSIIFVVHNVFQVDS